MARPGLDKHPKYRMLCRLLGEPRPHVRGYLEMLWEVAYENGDDVIGSEAAVEAAAEYPGAPGKLFKALMECGGDKAGFIEKTPLRKGCYSIHDLYDHAPEYVKKRFSREAERKGKTADNGGRCPTTADNGRKRRASQHPAPSTHTHISGQKETDQFRILFDEETCAPIVAPLAERIGHSSGECNLLWKVAALRLARELTENDLADSAEATRAADRRKPLGYFRGCIENRVGGKDALKALLARVHLPRGFAKGPPKLAPIAGDLAARLRATEADE